MRIPPLVSISFTAAGLEAKLQCKQL